MPMDPEKIRENMRRLSRIGEPGSPGGPAREARSGSAKPLWEPLPGDDLKDIEAEQEKLKRLRSSRLSNSSSKHLVPDHTSVEGKPRPA